jgi:hypothetical protein
MASYLAHATNQKSPWQPKFRLASKFRPEKKFRLAEMTRPETRQALASLVQDWSEMPGRVNVRSLAPSTRAARDVGHELMARQHRLFNPPEMEVQLRGILIILKPPIPG